MSIIIIRMHLLILQGYTPREQSKQLTLADGSLEYFIHLGLSQAHRRIRIKSDGTFVCLQ